MEGCNNECGICLETYNESENRPLVLPCSHSFCQGCLMKLEESNTKKCSICRRTWNDAKVKDLVYCIQLIPSISANATKKDAVKCSEHAAEANSWCTTCDETVCVRCLRLPKHKGCKWMLLEEKEYDTAVKKLADIVSKNERAYNEIDRLVEQLLLDRDAVTVWRKKAKSLLAECPRVDRESGTDFPSSELQEKTQSLAEFTAHEPAKEYAKLASLLPYNRPSISSSSRPTNNVTSKINADRSRPSLPVKNYLEAFQKEFPRSPTPDSLSTIRPPDSVGTNPSLPPRPFRPSRNSTIYQPTPFLLPTRPNDDHSTRK